MAATQQQRSSNMAVISTAALGKVLTTPQAHPAHPQALSYKHFLTSSPFVQMCRAFRAPPTHPRSFIDLPSFFQGHLPSMQAPVFCQRWPSMCSTPRCISTHHICSLNLTALLSASGLHSKALDYDCTHCGRATYPSSTPRRLTLLYAHTILYHKDKKAPATMTASTAAATAATVATLPLRIASFLPAATEMLFSLGLGDLVCGITHECDYPPEVRVLFSFLLF